MKAIVYKQYGSPDVLRLEDVPMPLPKDNEVQIKVKAASINSRDWDMLTGKPKLYRMIYGLLKPRYPIIGTDISGIVTEVGSLVKTIQVGDEVFGANPEDGFGAFAEYICLPDRLVCHKDTEMSFEEAACIPEAGLLAYQGLNSNNGIKAGQKVLINGGGGGAGTFAIQVAKHYGAHVTGVDSDNKLDTMLALGADEVLDYRKQDFCLNKQLYDFILDCQATRAYKNCRASLKPSGTYAAIGGKVSIILQLAFLGSLLPRKQGNKLGLVIYRPNVKDFKAMSDLIKTGIVRPVIDKCFKLNETPQAMHYFASGKFKGKIVISMSCE